MAMRGPVFAEGLERARRQWDEAVLGPLAAMDVDHHAGGVDVADLEVEALAEPEAQRVDGPEVGAVVGRADGGDEAADLVDGEDVGEALLPGDAEAFEGGPVAWDGVRIEELDAAVGDAEGGGGEVAVVLEVEEIVAELRLRRGGRAGCGSGRRVVGRRGGRPPGCAGRARRAGGRGSCADGATRSCRGPLARSEEITTARNLGPTVASRASDRWIGENADDR